MRAIILCGGLSTRLGEITKSIPKILLDIRGQAILDWQLQKLKAVGVTEVVMAAGHLAHVLQQEIGPERQGIKMIYAIEPERLGTGGAIKFAWSYLPDNGEPVFILNGDILTSIDLPKMVSCLRSDSDGIILGAKVDDASAYGTLDFDYKYHLKQFKEKEGLKQPAYINGGYYLFNDRANNYFPSDKNVFSIEYDVFPLMRNLDVYASDRPWLDVGVPERLQWARDNWQ